MALFAREENYFGLDVGTTGIRVVQLRRSGAKPTMLAFGEAKVDPGVTGSDSGADLDKVAGIIRQLSHDTRINTKNVVAGLPSAKIFASIITMPKLSDAEIAKAIKYQADQYIPMPLDQVKLDWGVIGPGANAEEIEVLLVAAASTVIDKYVKLCEKAGLELVALEPNTMAVSRAMIAPANSAVVLLDISSTSTDLAMVYNGVPRLLRSIPVGGTTFVRSVQQHLGLDETQAEQFTFRFGLTKAKLEGQVLKAVKSSLDTLMSEVDKSTKFFLGRYPAVKLEKVVITGGTTALPELPTYIANATGLPVELGNAWINVAYPAGLQDKLMSISGNYAVATGLAERSLL